MSVVCRLFILDLFLTTRLAESDVETNKPDNLLVISPRGFAQEIELHLDYRVSSTLTTFQLRMREPFFAIVQNDQLATLPIQYLQYFDVLLKIAKV